MVDEGLINTIAYSLWLNDLGKIIGCHDGNVMLKTF
jgi:hypothetical protein